MSTIKTPETHPDHPVVGRYWGAHSIKHNWTAIYYCDSYDPAAGFWMSNVDDKTDRTCISERAPMRTWWPVEDRGDHFYISQWGVKVAKTATTTWFLNESTTLEIPSEAGPCPLVEQLLDAYKWLRLEFVTMTQGRIVVYVRLGVPTLMFPLSWKTSQ